MTNKYNIEKDWLYDQYINKKKSTRQIAKEIGCSSRMIPYYLNKFNILARTKSECLLLRSHNLVENTLNFTTKNGL